MYIYIYENVRGRAGKFNIKCYKYIIELLIIVLKKTMHAFSARLKIVVILRVFV